jgi:hypothetical protein
MGAGICGPGSRPNTFHQPILPVSVTDWVKLQQPVDTHTQRYSPSSLLLGLGPGGWGHSGCILTPASHKPLAASNGCRMEGATGR